MSNIIYNLNNISDAAQIIIDKSNHKILSFDGVMGSGKTTLIKIIIHKLGSSDKGNSPTFGIVNEYRSAKGELIAYHLDCYRLESAEEALDFGIEEYLESDCWIFIEWPEKIAELLPPQRTEIHLKIVDAETRELMIYNLPR